MAGKKISQQPLAAAISPSTAYLLGNIGGVTKRVALSSLVNKINAGWFNVKGDGAFDSTAGFNTALAEVGEFGALEMPAGDFRIDNSYLAGKKIVLTGQGAGKTIIRPYNPDGTAITIGPNGSWDNLIFSNLTFQGAAPGTNGNAISFGHPDYVTDDELAGRMHLYNVKFIDFDKSIWRRWGNIGVYFHQCLFYKANYHIFTQGYTAGGGMHAGCMEINGGHMQHAEKAVLYTKSGSLGDGQIIFNGTIIEANPGMVAFLDTFSSDGANDIRFVNCWNEGNATHPTVDIEGNTYTTKWIRAKNVKSLTLTNTPPTTIELINSNIFGDGCDLTHLNVVKDANSSIEFDNALAQGLKSDVFVRNYKGSNKADNFSSFFSTFHRSHTSTAFVDNILDSISFTQAYNFSGSVARETVPIANDGVLFNIAGNLTINSGESLLTSQPCTIVDDKFYVYTLSYKLISGVPVTAHIVNGVSLMNGMSLSSNRWTTMAGVVDTKNNTGLPDDARLFLSVSSGTSVVRLGGYQLLQFNSQQEATEFINSKAFAINPEGGNSVSAGIFTSIGLKKEELLAPIEYDESDDDIIMRFYQAKNFPEVDQYGRVLDIFAGGANSLGGSIIRLITSDVVDNTVRYTIIDQNGNVSLEGKASGLPGTAPGDYVTKSQLDSASFGGSTAIATDFEITDSSKGYILKSPNNTRYRITVNNDGSLTTTVL